MTRAYGLENVRLKVSAHLTRVLLLYSRLRADYNPRYLPLTVHSIHNLIKELELLEKKYYGFTEILLENLERRCRHCRQDEIPVRICNAPTIKSFRLVLYEKASPLIKDYCRNESHFLRTTLASEMKMKSKRILLERTRQNCENLFAWCLPQDSILLLDLKNWCEQQLVNYEETPLMAERQSAFVMAMSEKQGNNSSLQF